MNRSIFKPIVFGSLFGALAFAAPFFLLRSFFLFLIVGGLMRLFVGARFRSRGMYLPVFADKIRNMSNEEYAAFRERFNGVGCGPRNRFQNESFKNDGPNESDFVQSPGL